MFSLIQREKLYDKSIRDSIKNCVQQKALRQLDFQQWPISFGISNELQ